MTDPLPSWRAGDTRQHIIDFVQAVTSQGSAQFVAPGERIATFDLDGTLWTEQPIYVQAEFTIDLFIKLHGGSPGTEPIKALLQRVRDGIADIHQSFATLESLVRATLSVDEYILRVQEWLAIATHPRFARPYTSLIYQPMLELLDYLRENQFRIYMVSGSGIEFARAFSAATFEIPPEQVIGSSLKTDFLVDPDGSNARLDLLPWPDFIDNGKRKAESINEFTGRCPIAAFGNSDGDQQMLEWTAIGNGARLMLLVHHTDAVREYSYDTHTRVGRLDLALAEATRRGWDAVQNRGWIVVDMAQDWERIYP